MIPSRIMPKMIIISLSLFESNRIGTFIFLCPQIHHVQLSVSLMKPVLALCPFSKTPNTESIQLYPSTASKTDVYSLLNLRLERRMRAYQMLQGALPLVQAAQLAWVQRLCHPRSPAGLDLQPDAA